MRQMRILYFGALLLLAGLALPVMAQEPLTTNRATEMRSAPDDSATVVKRLPEKTQLQLLERKSAWSRVKSGNDTGWVRMMHLRGGATVVVDEQTATGSWLARMERLLSGSGGNARSSNQRAQSATVGIRGFSREDVASAELNPAELEKLKRFQASDAAATRLANERRLAFRSVAYLAQDAVEAANTQGARK
jgi:Bacterial SH3 domain